MLFINSMHPLFEKHASFSEIACILFFFYRNLEEGKAYPLILFWITRIKRP